MTNEEEKLVTDNINLAYDIAWKYHIKFKYIIELEELQSICLYGLTKASKNFNKELNFAFSTFAYRVIINEILYYFRSNKNHLNNIHLSDTIGENLELEDTISDDYDIVEELQQNENIKILYQYIDDLKPRYKKIMQYRLKGLTFNEIGNLLGISQPQASRDYQKALNILRYKFRDWR